MVLGLWCKFVIFGATESLVSFRRRTPKLVRGTAGGVAAVDVRLPVNKELSLFQVAWLLEAAIRLGFRAHQFANGCGPPCTPKPETRNLKPETRKPETGIRNRRPETRNTNPP